MVCRAPLHSRPDVRTIVPVAVSEVDTRLRLLEREGILEALDGALAEASAGCGRIFLLAGEAGVGKTAAVQAFCARRAGVRTLWGDCDDLFTPRPLGPFVAAARDGGGELARALQADAGAHEVAAALIRQAGSRPTLMVLEDLHWADEATLDVLLVLARSIGRAPLLVVGTYRDDELDKTHPLRVVLGDLSPREPVGQLAVPRLSAAAVAELAGPAGVDPAELYRQTSGNPFFVTEVLASGNGTIPGTIRAAVLGRAARLSLAAREVLDAVAISPRRVEVWLLEALAGEHAEALEECLTSGMLGARPGAVEFRHELARRAIDEALEPRRRIALHREAVAALARPPVGSPDLFRLAHHAEAAGDGGAVLRYSPGAGDRAAELGAHREAAAQYARALRFVDPADLPLRADLLRRYSDACYLTDRCQAAIDAARELVECYRDAGDRFKEGETLCLESLLEMCPGSAVDAEPDALRAVALLEEFPPGPELALAYANLAAIRMNLEDEEATRLWAGRALELARSLGETETVSHALNSLGTMLFLAHGPTERGPAEESLRLAVRDGLGVPILRAYSNMAWAAWRHRDYARAEELLQSGLSRCREPDFDLWRLLMSAYRSCVHLELGRWDEALRWARIAAGDFRSSPLPRILGKLVIGLVGVRRGDPAEASLVDEAFALAAPSGELQRIGPAACAAAEVAWLAGDATGVATATAPALGLALQRRSLPLVGQLACWRLRAGFAPDDLPAVPEPWSLELAGRLTEAADRWTAMGCDYEAALVLAQAADEPSLRRSHDTLRELGAPAAAAIVARRLREQGVRDVPRGPRATTRQNAGQLTARELDVLQLLAEGLRNAAIAERLFLSRRTVDCHVSNVLRKLEVSSRGEAVAAARRLELLGDA
jgi:DNA-binding CsgD family transcriptional regulator/tetratricopeptide (TPR) repeat protein